VPGEGFASIAAAIPDDPALLGAQLFVQALVADPAASSGLASTRGAELTFFRP